MEFSPALTQPVETEWSELRLTCECMQRGALPFFPKMTAGHFGERIYNSASPVLQC